MPLSDVTKEGIGRAREEFDSLGRDGMLAKYGGGPSTRWYIAYGERYYDLKLVLRAAHQLQGLGSLPSGRGTFTSYQARKHLTKLDLQVVGYAQMGELPQPLLRKIVGRLALHTVGFFRQDRRPPELFGSGVLVSVGDKRAILTAEHVISEVIEKLPTTERLGLVLEGRSLPQTIDRQGITICKIGRGTKSPGPDLGALILAPIIARSIESVSIKSFYNLDNRRDQLLCSPPGLEEGIWVAQGLVEEKTVVTPISDDFVRVGFRGDGLIGRPGKVETICGYDYMEYLVDPLGSNTPGLRSWGGMSGGGLWQITLQSQRSSLDLDYNSPLLSGILFWEQRVDGEMWIRCHGRISVYERAYQAIQKFSP